jgi:chromosome segregation protein
MYLSRLEILGFKSFADKADFRFTDGMAAIVGPNGCGKTNVVDAIRWVLGEQKTAVLRSDIMENVIFNGSKARKPLGMAEVTLTLQNNKRILPSEYSEVTISRRLFRNGDSQYLLNKSKCRLKDIIDLFMDTGMGADSYSVIELKMVESILSGRVEERRHLIEEAAGVNKYKLRRKEAGKKLEGVQTDLIRVEDIRKEIEKNVNTLARQASKTRKYNRLLEELNQLEIAHIHYEYDLLKGTGALLESEMEGYVRQKEESENLFGEAVKNTEDLNARRNQTEEDFKEAGRKESELNSLIHERKQEIAVSQEKLSNLLERQGRLEKEKSDAETNIKKASVNLGQIEEKIKGYDSKLGGIQQEIDNAKKNVNDASDKVKGLRAISSETQTNLLTIRGSINTLNESNLKNQTKKKNLGEKINDSRDEIAKIEESIRIMSDDLLSSDSEKSRMDAALQTSREELNSNINKQKELQTAIDELKSNLMSQNSTLKQKEAELGFIEGLIDSAASSQYLFKTQDWNISGERILLEETVAVDDKYKIAVDSALGSLGKYFVVDNDEEAGEAIKLLLSKNKGRATFITRNRIPQTGKPNDLGENVGIYGHLSELVRTDDDLRNLLRLLLPGAIIVENQEVAKDAINNSISSMAVTLNGEIYSAYGIIKGGSVSTDEGARLGRKEKTNKLKSEIRTLNESIIKQNEELRSLLNQIGTLNIQNLEREIKSKEHTLAGLNQKSAQSRMKIDSLNGSIEMIQANISRYQGELTEIDADGGSFDDNQKELESKLKDAEKAHFKAISEVEAAENEAETLQTELNLVEKKLIELNAEYRSLMHESELQKSSIIQYEELKEIRRSDIELNREAIGGMQKHIAQIVADAEETSIKYDEAKNKFEYISEQLHSIQQQLDQANTTVNSYRKQLDSSVGKIHEAELRLNAVRSQIRNLNDRALEQFNSNLDEIEFVPDEEYSVEDNRQTIRMLKDKLSAIGSVNFLALEEYEKENERLIFYEKQMKDLADSEKTLQETINEINLTAEKKFTDTFDRIKVNFASLFQKLFGEDAFGELKLGEGNPLECDIEIIAKPPGKKPHSIEQISSGEKTLTAIAMLFSIYLVKPSPFCILDEVDAPLDDTNIGKFVDLIREFSSNTQFMIVTHNKKTMEAAESLYGVTMQENGVSKVVSVRLSPEMN